jgi:hypothetical protein
MKFYLLLIFSLALINLNSQNLVITKKAAKINNEIILIRDVEKYSKFYKVSLTEAKTELIEESILYYGAKNFSQEPDEAAVDNQVKSDKSFYSKNIGKDIKEVTDEEFLSALPSNNSSMKDYSNYVKRTLWIERYLKDAIAKEKEKPFEITDKQIDDLVKKKPELFEEKESIVLSMIYLSYYDSEGKKKTNDKIKTLPAKASECLTLLNKGEKFEKMAGKYSDDLVSLNKIPIGRVGLIVMDDPRIKDKFSSEILKFFKDSSGGLINKIFKTEDGLFIFNVDEKINAKKLSKEEIKLKAEAYLQKENEQNILLLVRSKLIKTLKEQIDMEIY